MKITSKVLERISMERNLLSCIKNLVILAECIKELQRSIDEIQLRVGIPRKFEDPSEKVKL
jgi:hypothetical protein